MSFSSNVKEELSYIKQKKHDCEFLEMVKNSNTVPCLKKLSCKREFLRIFFISSGSINDPKKAYHLEFDLEIEAFALKINELLLEFNIKSNILKRKKRFVVYIKESESIVDVLNVMGATKSLLEMENLRVLKSVRNDVNRIVNCETANSSKIAKASVDQEKDIKFIDETVGLFTLSNQLQEVAEKRLENPYASLKEIGLMLTPVVGKSGVNHRLRKISEIALNLREGNYD